MRQKTRRPAATPKEQNGQPSCLITRRSSVGSDSLSANQHANQLPKQSPPSVVQHANQRHTAVESPSETRHQPNNAKNGERSTPNEVRPGSAGGAAPLAQGGTTGNEGHIRPERPRSSRPAIWTLPSTTYGHAVNARFPRQPCLLSKPARRWPQTLLPSLSRSRSQRRVGRINRRKPLRNVICIEGSARGS